MDENEQDHLHHSSADMESDTTTILQISEPSEEKTAAKVLDTIWEFLYSVRPIIVFILAVLILLGFLLTNVFVTAVNLENKESSLNAGKLIIMAGTTGLVIMNLEFMIDRLSLANLTKGGSFLTLWFYVNELSIHIAYLTVVSAIYLYCFVNISNFYIKNSYGYKLYVFNVIRLSIVLATVLGGERAFFKSISMGFNYSLYISRMRKSILLNSFLIILEHLDNNIDTALSDYHRLANYDARSVDKTLFHPKFMAKNPEIDAKRFILKLFQHIVSHSSPFRSSLAASFVKIRKKSKIRASKIMQKINSFGRNTSLKDLIERYPDRSILRIIARHLDLATEFVFTREVLTDLIEKGYKERLAISKSLEHINSALYRVEFCCQLLIVFLTLCLMYISATGEINLVFGTISGIFGANVVYRLLSDHVIRSIIFLFIIHPFDIGDRVLITLNGVQENLIVAELNIFSTLFCKWDGTSFFVPNILLCDTPITNIRRSNAIMENHCIQISSLTPTEYLCQLKTELIEFCKANSEAYTDYVLVNYDKIEDSNKLYVKILMQYKSNSQNYDEYLRNRSNFLIHLNNLIQALDITYKLPTRTIRVVSEKLN
jgi:Mechanosensitive ion channel